MSYPWVNENGLSQAYLQSIIHGINFYQGIKRNASYRCCILAEALSEEEMKTSDALTRNTFKERMESEWDFIP